MNKIFGTAALALTLTGAALAPSTATAAPAPQAPAGTTSLAEVLGADGVAFDQKWGDFDITEAAVYAVLDAKPKSPVGLLAKGGTRLTAFVPTDRAFQLLVEDVSGKKYNSEKKVFAAAATLGIGTIETVLLYHVIPGKTLDSGKVVAAEGKPLATALDGATFTVAVQGKKVKLLDGDTSDENARGLVFDVNKGNRQIAHAINRVLRPTDF